MISAISRWFNHIDWIYQRALWSHLPGIILGYFLQLAPYVIIGVLIGEALKFTSWTKLIYRYINSRPLPAVFFATGLGIISPLCTYGTVPVLITLYGAGISVYPLISFLAASSMMNPQLFIMTGGGLGWDMAAARLLSVLIFGIFIGLATMLIPERFIVREKLLSSDKEPIENRTKPPFTWKSYLKNSFDTLLFVLKMMLIGILIASLVELLPVNLWMEKIDVTSPFSVVLAAVAGIPLYACGGGTIPMISSLMAQGMSRGSALAFMIAGPATRITSLAAICVILKKRYIALYIVLLLLFSVAAGIYYI